MWLYGGTPAIMEFWQKWRLMTNVGLQRAFHSSLILQNSYSMGTVRRECQKERARVIPDIWRRAFSVPRNAFPSRQYFHVNTNFLFKNQNLFAAFSIVCFFPPSLPIPSSPTKHKATYFPSYLFLRRAFIFDPRRLPVFSTLIGVIFFFCFTIAVVRLYRRKSFRTDDITIYFGTRAYGLREILSTLGFLNGALFGKCFLHLYIARLNGK